MKCSQCQHENRPQAKFCEECGTKLQAVCPNCGIELRPQAKFCDECGTRIAETISPAGETTLPRFEDMQKQLQSRIPESLADKLFAGAKEMQGEHRLVTAIFADVVGSSKMAREMPLDQYADTMNDCFKMMVDTISIEYEGSINRFIGDCVLAFFGAPITHENDAERAILAALAIRHGVKELELDISIGINTGMTYVGEMGRDLVYTERSAWGPDVDFAKRLQDAAGPGEIYVGASTYRLTNRAFDFGTPVNIPVKGMEERQTAYPVLRVRERPEKLRGIEGLKARMIGREKEFVALINCADTLMNERRGQLATIVGEAGIGKSRLVRELKDYVADKDVQWLEGRCLSIGQSVSFWPFIDMMRTYLGISTEDSEPEISDKLVQGMISIFGQEAEGIIPYIGYMLSVKLDKRYQELIRYAAPEQIRRQMLLRMRDVFVALARRQPLVMILEDMHWADDLSLDLLWVLLDELVAAPMLLVCIHRPEREHGSWQIDGVASNKHLERYTRLPLSPLTHEQTQQMVESLLAIEALPSETRESVLERTGGNPFFVEEVIRLLIEQDFIYYEDERWKAKDTIRNLTVPDTVQSVVLSRIDRLQAEVQYVLQCASVIGRVFQRRLLGYIAGQEDSIEGHLSQLETNELVYKEKVLPELEYAFKHALTQETTYQRLLSRQKQMFHERVGNGIETLYQEQIEEYYEQLAYHYSRSDNKEKAIEYLVKAGQKAAGRYANQEALSYLTQALELAELDEQRNYILENRAKVFASLFRGEEAANDCEQLLEIARRSRNRNGELEAILGLAGAYYIMALDAQGSDSISRCRELYETAYVLAQELDNQACMARALIPTAWFVDFWPEYKEQAFANIKEALALSEELSDDNLIIDIKMVMVGVLRLQGNFEAAIEQGEELADLLESHRDLVRLKEVYYLFMGGHLSLGNFERCIEYCDAGIRLAAELGVPPVQYPTIKARALINLGHYDSAWDSLHEEPAGEEHQLGRAMRAIGLGELLLDLMAYEKASQIFEDVIEQGKHLKRSWLVSWAQQRLAKSLIQAGQLDEEGFYRITPNLAPYIAILGLETPEAVMAEFALSKGRLDDALQQAEKACSSAEESSNRAVYASVLELKSRVLLRQGKPEEVIAVTDRGIQMAEEISYRPMLWRLRAAKAQALGRLGREEEASQEYERAATTINQLADTIPDAELKQNFLSNPVVFSLISRVKKEVE